MRRWAIVAATAGLAVLAAVGLYRVFAPDEVLTGATGELPAPPAAPDRGSGVVGTLPWAPLFVDDRLRVYATDRQVHADGPIDFRVQTTPYWSLRRWPTRVVGVVAAGDVVVSRWSDGELVALDARSGAERWRASGPATEGESGVGVAWAPPGLHVAGDLIVVVGGPGVLAYRTTDGGVAWSRPFDACVDRSFTTAAGQVAVVCSARITLLDPADGGDVTSLPAAGRVEPLGCAAAWSGCGGVRAGDQAWLLGAGTPVAAPALAGPDARLVDGLAISHVGRAVLARDARTGAERWTEVVAGAVVATQPGRVHLLTDDLELVTLDAATGAERSRFRYVAEDGAIDWDRGLSYAANGYLVTQRLHEPAYPYPMILAAT
jgi:outer membrane protein assembly factor BamB